MTFPVKGVDMDGETRCKHYATEKDIIAIRMGCCNVYYACYKCHEEMADHAAMPVSKDDFDQPHVFCGHCQSEWTVREYLNSGYRCPKCHALFNEGCRLHYDLYFERINNE
ncbi:CHY zinc finger protein [Tuberibacillus sp. Marseille-P3662]|uniref:CHY zinc finger protein n=1 Tax=Tuberibacillus sp. Marseille-P3662 TaxID=1965358 RepID=UPI000A1CAF90|nr:CHY zinc finger protein [Tuberibacillus sp. Marseille-P3662]